VAIWRGGYWDGAAKPANFATGSCTRGWPRPLGLNQELPLGPPDAAAALDWEV
jgi:hypothetical protein